MDFYPDTESLGAYLGVLFLLVFAVSLVLIAAHKTLVVRRELLRHKPIESMILRGVIHVLVCCGIWAFARFGDVGSWEMKELFLAVIDACLMVGVVVVGNRLIQWGRRQPLYRQRILGEPVISSRSRNTTDDAHLPAPRDTTE